MGRLLNSRSILNCLGEFRAHFHDTKEEEQKLFEEELKKHFDSFVSESIDKNDELKEEYSLASFKELLCLYDCDVAAHRKGSFTCPCCLRKIEVNFGYFERNLEPVRFS
jgi:hypothetical protein